MLMWGVDFFYNGLDSSAHRPLSFKFVGDVYHFRQIIKKKKNPNKLYKFDTYTLIIMATRQNNTH